MFVKLQHASFPKMPNLFPNSLSINDSFSDIVNYENDNSNSNNLSGIKNFDNNSLGI